MFSKEEAREKKTEFWTCFGVYMRKHKSKSGLKIKWVNYNTRVKDIYFRLHCNHKEARVSIDIQHKDEDIRLLFLEQFKALKHLIPDPFLSESLWLSHNTDQYQKTYSTIFVSMDNANLFRKEDWEKIFPFYEKHILAIDTFWSEFAEIFIDLS